MKRLLTALLVLAAALYATSALSAPRPPTLLSDSHGYSTLTAGQTVNIAELTVPAGHWLLIGHISAIEPAGAAATDASVLLAGNQDYWNFQPGQFENADISVPVYLAAPQTYDLQIIVGFGGDLDAGTRVLWAVPLP